MSKICFLYVQTASQQKDYNIPYLDFNNWTRMVSLSYFISNEYLEKKTEFSDYIIRPYGFLIENEAFNIHKISNEIAINKGVIINDLFDKIENIFSKTRSRSIFGVTFLSDLVLGLNTRSDSPQIIHELLVNKET